MSTFLESMDGRVTLRNADDAQKFVDEYWGETTSDWEHVLSSALAEHASGWDVEAKQELCDPVRIWKSKSGEGDVCGTSLIYYPGFEDEFIRSLPDEIVKAFKEKGEKAPIGAAEAHWTIDYPLGINGEHNFVCSSCGIHSWLNTEYCPHCGAKMAKGWKWKAEEAKQGSK